MATPASSFTALAHAMPGGETEKQPSGWTVDTLLAAFTEWQKAHGQDTERRWADHELETERRWADHEKQTEISALSADRRYEQQQKGVETALAAAEKATSAAFAAAEKSTAAQSEAAARAVEKAEQAQLRVNIGQNEFRQQLKDQAADLMPRKETETLVAGIRQSLENLQGRLDRMEGTHQGSAGLWAILAGGLTLLLAAIGIAAAWLKH